MFLYKKSELIGASTLETKNYSRGDIIESEAKKAAKFLNESTKSFTSNKTFDVFLSHSIKDARIILGLKIDLEKKGLSVYVDWIEDEQIDRSKVTQDNADIIRTRISCCKSLLYALSEESKLSSWVQWELGYADGKINGKVAIVPIQGETIDNSFYRQEYLGLYPVIDHGSEKDHLWVNRGSDYCGFQRWIAGKKYRNNYDKN